MRSRLLAIAVLVLTLTLTACKTDECELGEAPCNGPTNYLECHETSSHVPDLSSDANRFIEHSCGELFSMCVPQGDDGHECVLGFEADTCDVLPIGTLQDESDLVAVQVGDLSDDGHADLLLVSLPGLSLRRHTPEGTFAPSKALPEQTRPIDSAPFAWTVAPLDSTNAQADFITLGDGMVGFVPRSCL